MANVPNPGANATSPTCSNSEDTIEVVLMSAIHSSSSEPFYDAPLPSAPSAQHDEELLSSNYFAEAFFPNNYPSPDEVHVFDPYPILSHRTHTTHEPDLRRDSVAISTADERSVVQKTVSHHGNRTSPSKEQDGDVDLASIDVSLVESMDWDTGSSQAEPTESLYEDTAVKDRNHLGHQEEERLTSILHDTSEPYSIANAVGRPERTERLGRTLDTLSEVASAGRSNLDCSICGRAFKNKNGLQHHKVVHNGARKRRYKCSSCHKGFRYPKDLRRHELTHGEANHICLECGTRFKRLDHLQRHQKGHIASSAYGMLHPRTSMDYSSRPQSRGRLPSFDQSSQGPPSSASAIEEAPLRNQELLSNARQQLAEDNLEPPAFQNIMASSLVPRLPGPESVFTPSGSSTGSKSFFPGV